jgi:hypothetical protein
MKTAANSETVHRLPATLRLGPVRLTVANLDRSVPWYESALGLRVHRRDGGAAELGDGFEAVVVLHEDPHARPAGRHAGLYHYALSTGAEKTSPGRLGGSRRRGRRSRACPTTARTRRSTCPIATGTASSSAPTGRAVSGRIGRKR